MIVESEKRKILQVYLGEFAVKPSPASLELFKARFRKLETVMVKAPPKVLKELGCYFLLNFGRLHYRKVFTYDIIETFLGHVEEGQPINFCDTSVPLLIIYHMRNTMENRQLQNLTAHTVCQRSRLLLPTLVLSETPLPTVETAVVSLGKEVVSLLAMAGPGSPSPVVSSTGSTAPDYDQI